ncbi:hypothetical protein C8J57DRAFT_1533293 [Mycena rebaudengoi]|nr:hypothetical protein C8J57DRAFT_1533293 [Mycena rebaudengoi]
MPSHDAYQINENRISGSVLDWPSPSGDENVIRTQPLPLLAVALRCSLSGVPSDLLKPEEISQKIPSRIILDARCTANGRFGPASTPASSNVPTPVPSTPSTPSSISSLTLSEPPTPPRSASQERLPHGHTHDPEIPVAIPVATPVAAPTSRQIPPQPNPQPPRTTFYNDDDEPMPDEKMFYRDRRTNENPHDFKKRIMSRFIGKAMQDAEKIEALGLCMASGGAADT